MKNFVVRKLHPRGPEYVIVGGKRWFRFLLDDVKTHQRQKGYTTLDEAVDSMMMDASAVVR